jgi:hypothetical protein
VHHRVKVIAGSMQWPMQLFIPSFVNDFPYRSVAKRDKKIEIIIPLKYLNFKTTQMKNEK